MTPAAEAFLKEEDLIPAHTCSYSPILPYLPIFTHIVASYMLVPAHTPSNAVRKWAATTPSHAHFQKGAPSGTPAAGLHSPPIIPSGVCNKGPLLQQSWVPDHR
mmetsp:Transcript_95977/g.161259  ORF Transcript_95977/g.161259 Transcript_95977/m.161259 type:complete len:104 (-) Transcript_95977:103-414(-)